MLIEEMKHQSDLRLSSHVDSSEEALLDAVATSTPMRRSRVISLPTLQSDGYIYGTGYDTVERALNDEAEDLLGSIIRLAHMR